VTGVQTCALPIWTYHQLLIVAILLGDKYLFDFAAGNQECVLYNHHYHDGLNGEGALSIATTRGAHDCTLARIRRLVEAAIRDMQEAA
jgi:hypothetical protein